MALNFKGVKKILVIKLRHIGDVLLTIPVFRALRETFPHAHITGLVNSGTEEVLLGNPLIDEIIIFDRKIKNFSLIKRYFSELRFLKQVKSKAIDLVIDLTSGDRAAIISFISRAKYRLARDPKRKGFLGKRYLYTHLANVDSRMHMVLQNLEVVRQFGISTDNLTVDMFVSEADRKFAERIIKKDGYTKIVHVHPSARWLFKCWKDEYMADVIGWLIKQGIKVVVTSSPEKNEIGKTKQILSLVLTNNLQNRSQLVDLCGKTTIKQLAAISAVSDLFFGVDSAPMHIAAAVGTPVVAIFGPTGDIWRPWGSNNIVISKKMDCKPCRKFSCDGIQERACMVAVTPDDVKKVLASKFTKEYEYRKK